MANQRVSRAIDQATMCLHQAPEIDADQGRNPTQVTTFPHTSGLTTQLNPHAASYVPHTSQSTTQLNPHAASYVSHTSRSTTQLNPLAATYVPHTPLSATRLDPLAATYIPHTSQAVTQLNPLAAVDVPNASQPASQLDPLAATFVPNASIAEDEYMSGLDKHDDMIYEDFHHINWLGMPVRRRTATTPAVSLCAILAMPKKEYTDDEINLCTSVLLRNAFHLVDPVLFNGDLNTLLNTLRASSGTALQDAVIGACHKFYSERGWWQSEACQPDDDVPVIDTMGVLDYKDGFVVLNGWYNAYGLPTQESITDASVLLAAEYHHFRKAARKDGSDGEAKRQRVGKQPCRASSLRQAVHCGKIEETSITPTSIASCREPSPPASPSAIPRWTEALPDLDELPVTDKDEYMIEGITTVDPLHTPENVSCRTPEPATPEPAPPEPALTAPAALKWADTLPDLDELPGTDEKECIIETVPTVDLLVIPKIPSCTTSEPAPIAPALPKWADTLPDLDELLGSDEDEYMVEEIQTVLQKDPPEKLCATSPRNGGSYLLKVRNVYSASIARSLHRWVLNYGTPIETIIEDEEVTGDCGSLQKAKVELRQTLRRTTGGLNVHRLEKFPDLPDYNPLASPVKDGEGAVKEGSELQQAVCWAPVLDDGPKDMEEDERTLVHFGAHLTSGVDKMEQPVAPSNGTAGMPFEATVMKDKPTSTQSNSYQSISFMQPYQNHSPEELRQADYNAGRRYGNSTGQAGEFGGVETLPTPDVRVRRMLPRSPGGWNIHELVESRESYEYNNPRLSDLRPATVDGATEATQSEETLVTISELLARRDVQFALRNSGLDREAQSNESDSKAATGAYFESETVSNVTDMSGDSNTTDTCESSVPSTPVECEPQVTLNFDTAAKALESAYATDPGTLTLADRPQWPAFTSVKRASKQSPRIPVRAKVKKVFRDFKGFFNHEQNVLLH